MRPTIGLYYNGARYLAAWLGRWTSADPIGIGADGPGLYNYVRGSPVNYTDPSGTETTQEMEATLQAQRWAVEQVHIAHMARQKAEHDAPPADAIEARARRTINRHEREELKAAVEPATLVIAASKLGEPGASSAVTAHRKTDAAYMLENAKTLVTKLKGRESVQLEQVETGKELLGALEQATSKFGAIKNVVLYGHGGAGSLYLRNDAGFYQNPEGAWDDPDERMLSLGATTVGDLEERMKVDPKTGVKPIEFAPDATIVIGACNCGFGSSSISKDIAQVTGARVISAGRGAQPDRANNPANREILESRGGWKSFQRALVNGAMEVRSKNLPGTLLDPKKYVR